MTIDSPIIKDYIGAFYPGEEVGDISIVRSKTYIKYSEPFTVSEILAKSKTGKEVRLLSFSGDKVGLSIVAYKEEIAKDLFEEPDTTNNSSRESDK